MNILLVEDNPADVNLVRRAMDQSKLSCKLHHVADGLDALDFLRRNGERYENMPQPDLILLDLNMPRMNGRELLTVIKTDEYLSYIPVVVFTQSDSEIDVESVYRSGASGFIVKPDDMPRLVETLHQIVAYITTLTRVSVKV